jgi:hypothetical protein
LTAFLERLSGCAAQEVLGFDPLLSLRDPDNRSTMRNGRRRFWLTTVGATRGMARLIVASTPVADAPGSPAVPVIPVDPVNPV